MAELIPEHWVSRPQSEIALNEEVVAGQLGFAPEQIYESYEFLTTRIAEQNGFQWVNHGDVNGYDGDTDHIMTNGIIDYEEVLFPTCADQECSRNISIVSGCVIVSCETKSFSDQEDAELRDDVCGECHFDVAKTVARLVKLRATDVKRLDEEKIAEQNRHQQVISSLDAQLNDLL